MHFLSLDKNFWGEGMRSQGVSVSVSILPTHCELLNQWVVAIRCDSISPHFYCVLQSQDRHLSRTEHPPSEAGVCWWASDSWHCWATFQTFDVALESQGVDSVMTPSGKGTYSTNYLKGDLCSFWPSWLGLSIKLFSFPPSEQKADKVHPGRAIPTDQLLAHTLNLS